MGHGSSTSRSTWRIELTWQEIRLWVNTRVRVRAEESDAKCEKQRSGVYRLGLGVWVDLGSA